MRVDSVSKNYFVVENFTIRATRKMDKIPQYFSEMELNAIEIVSLWNQKPKDVQYLRPPLQGMSPSIKNFTPPLRD